MLKNVVFVALVFLFACDSSYEPKPVTFKDGRTEIVGYEVGDEPDGGKILIVSYRSEKQVVLERKVFSDVREIWKQVKSVAESREIDEGLVRYIYFAETDNETGKPKYRIMLFETERKESGSWAIRKIN